MKELYSVENYEKMNNKRKNMLTFYFVLLGISLLAIIGIIIYYAGEPYGSPKEKLLKTIMCVIISLFVLFSFLFFTITYGRVNNYTVFLHDSINGRKTTSNVTVLSVSNIKEDLKNISFYSFEVLEWDEKKQDYFKRRVLIDAEIKIDDLHKDAIIEMQTVGNVLYAYEVKN